METTSSPAPEKLDPKDPSVPGWATGQIDELQFEIYKALKQYEVKTPGGQKSYEVLSIRFI